MTRRTTIAIASLMLSACGAAARLAVRDGTGAQPNIPPPHHSVLPTVNVVKARGWPAEAKPIAADGLTVTAFARRLDHPRWIYVLPNGDVLVAETNAPTRPDDNKGIGRWSAIRCTSPTPTMSATVWRVARAAAAPRRSELP